MVVPRSSTYKTLMRQACNKTAFSAYRLQLHDKTDYKFFPVGKCRENEKYERDLRPL